MPSPDLIPDVIGDQWKETPIPHNPDIGIFRPEPADLLEDLQRPLVLNFMEAVRGSRLKWAGTVALPTALALLIPGAAAAHAHFDSGGPSDGFNLLPPDSSGDLQADTTAITADINSGGGEIVSDAAYLGTGPLRPDQLSSNFPENISVPQFPREFVNYKPSVNYVEGLGIVATDNLRVTHVYDTDNSQWNELENYIPVGTAKERVNRSLQDFLGTNNVENIGPVDNPLGLDSNEVAIYLKTGRTDNFKSFQILFNSKKEPLFFMVTGGENGVRGDPNNIQDIKDAVKRLDEIDPQIWDTLTIKNGLRAVSAWLNPATYSFEINAWTFSTMLGLVEVPEVTGIQNINGKVVPSIPRRLGVNYMMAALLVETRNMYSYRHLTLSGSTWTSTAPDRLDDKTGIDKGLWILKFTEENKSKLSPREIIDFTSNGKGDISNYSGPLSDYP